MFNENLKIMYLIPSLTGAGAEKQLTILAKELSEKGWKVSLVVLKGGPNLSRIMKANIQVYIVKHSSNYDPFIIYRLCKLVKLVNPCILQTWLPMMDILGGILALSFRIPWVLSERSSVRAHGSRKLKSIIRRFIGRYANCVIANSLSGASYWKSTNKAISVIPNAVVVEDSLSSIKLTKSNFGFNNDEKILLYVGRLIPEKNLDVLFKAFCSLMKDLELKLVLCGEGPSKSNLEGLATKLGIKKRVIFNGYMENVHDWMRISNLLVLNSIYEGMPNVILEAAACECPLVLSDIAEHRAVFDEDMVWFADPMNEDSLKCAIERCISSKIETERKIKLAKNAIAHLTPEFIAGNYNECYKQLLK